MAVISLAEVRQKKEPRITVRSGDEKRLDYARLLVETCDDLGIPVRPELRAAAARRGVQVDG